MTLQEQYNAAVTRIGELTAANTQLTQTIATLTADVKMLAEKHAGDVLALTELQQKMQTEVARAEKAEKSLVEAVGQLEKAKGQLALSPAHMDLAPGTKALASGDTDAPSVPAQATGAQLYDEWLKQPNRTRFSFFRKNEKALLEEWNRRAAAKAS